MPQSHLVSPLNKFQTLDGELLGRNFDQIHAETKQNKFDIKAMHAKISLMNEKRAEFKKAGQ